MENYVPIVVLGLSTSSASTLPSSTSMTLSWQEIDYPTSSSTSPPMTSSNVSSESVAGQERRDPCGIDPYPAAVWSKHVERRELEDPFSSEISEEQLLTRPTENPKPKKNVYHDQEGETRAFPVAARVQRKSCGWQSSWTPRLTRQFISWIIIGTYACEECGFG